MEEAAMNIDQLPNTKNAAVPRQKSTYQFIDWYCEGECRTVKVGGKEVAVRLVARKGRRARIAITIPVTELSRRKIRHSALLTKLPGSISH
jgi:hypothetical protein